MAQAAGGSALSAYCMPQAVQMKWGICFSSSSFRDARSAGPQSIRRSRLYMARFSSSGPAAADGFRVRSLPPAPRNDRERLAGYGAHTRYAAMRKFVITFAVVLAVVAVLAFVRF
jgi:hypothetical protein